MQAPVERTPASAADAAPRPRWIGYAVSVVAAGVCFAVEVALEPILQGRTIFLVFVPAVIAAAASGGLGPALAATALGLAANLALNEAALVGDPANLIDALLFLLLGPAIGFAANAWRSAPVRPPRPTKTSREREAHLRSILDTVPDAMVVIDERA